MKNTETWLNLKSAVLSQWRKPGSKAAYYVIPLTWHSRKSKTTGAEVRLVTARGCGGGQREVIGCRRAGLVGWGHHNRVPHTGGWLNRSLLSHGSGGCQNKSRCQRASPCYGKWGKDALQALPSAWGWPSCSHEIPSVCLSADFPFV